MYVSDNLDAFDSYEIEQERMKKMYQDYYEEEQEDDLPEHLVDIEWENDYAEREGVLDGFEIKEVY